MLHEHGPVLDSKYTHLRYPDMQNGSSCSGLAESGGLLLHSL